MVVPCNSSTWEAEAEACSVGLPLLHIRDSYVTTCVEQHNSNKQTPENDYRWRQFWNDNQDGEAHYFTTCLAWTLALEDAE